MNNINVIDGVGEAASARLMETAEGRLAEAFKNSRR
jgi:hypothetical protein